MIHNKLISILLLVPLLICGGMAMAAAPFEQNLLINPSAEDGYNGWERRNGGSGWGINESSHSWMSSYELCSMTQIVDLEAKGFSESDLSEAKVACGASYYNYWTGSGNRGKIIIEVTMLDENDGELEKISLADISFDGFIEWTAIHKEMALPEGTKKIKFYFAGKDALYWGGQYGPNFSKTEVVLFKGQYLSSQNKVTYLFNDNSQLTILPKVGEKLSKITMTDGAGTTKTYEPEANGAIVVENPTFDGPLSIETLTVPYYDGAGDTPFTEGFESGYEKNNPINYALFQILSTGNTWKGNTDYIDYGRLPHSGSNNAYLNSSCSWAHMGAYLEKGQTYYFKMFARSSADATMKVNYGVDLTNPAGNQPIIDTVLSARSNYDKLYNIFTPEQDGYYWISICGNTSGYVSIDDIEVGKFIEVSHNIRVDEAMPNGWITLDKTSAKPFETVTVSYGDGYYCKQNTSFDADTANLKWISPTQFVMPDVDVTISIDYLSPFAITIDNAFTEDFEAMQTNGDAVSGLWITDDGGGNNWTSNNSATTYNRAPYSGSWNVYLYSNTRWMFSYLELKKGCRYKFRMRARNSSTNRATVKVMLGSSPLESKMQEIVVEETTVTNGDYQELSGVIICSNDGPCWLGIKGQTSNYLSIDAISVEQMVQHGIGTEGASEHGSISLSKSLAFQYEEIIITPTCEISYEPDISIKDRNGNKIRIENNGGNNYSFTMPDDSVTVQYSIIRSKKHITTTSVENGYFSISEDSVYVGSTVKVACLPDDNYELLSLTATGVSTGSPIEISDDHEFVMPFDDVCISGSFRYQAQSITIIVEGDTTQVGNVKTNISKSYPGEFVGISVIRGKGYEIDEIHVYDKDNKDIDLKNFYFTMPQSPVTIKANFKEAVRNIKLAGNNGVFLGKKNNKYDVVFPCVAQEGDTINIWPIADTLFEYHGVEILAASGDEVPFVEKPFSFIMPYDDVTINGNFVDAPRVAYIESVNNGTITVIHDGDTISNENESLRLYKDETLTVKFKRPYGNQIAYLYYSYTSKTGKGSDSTFVKSISVINQAKNEEGFFNIIMPLSDIKINAGFSASKHEVVVKESKNGKISADSRFYQEGQTVSVNTKRQNGYVLKSITVVSATNDTLPVDLYAGSFVMPNCDVTVSAKFVPHVNNIDIVTDYSMGEVSVKSEDVNVESAQEGKMVYVSAMRKSGYELESVCVMKGNDRIVLDKNNAFIMPDSSVTVYCNFKKALRDIVIEQPMFGALNVNKESAQEGDRVTVSYIDTTGRYELDKIKVIKENKEEIAVSDESFIMPYSKVTVSATCKPVLFTMKVDSVRNGTLTFAASMQKGKVQKGDTVTLTATRTKGYELEYIWAMDFDSNAVVLDANNSFIMNSDVIAGAVFKPAMRTVNMVNPGNGSLGTNLSSAQEGESVLITYNRSCGFQLGSLKVVSDNGQNIAIKKDNTFTMPYANVTVSCTEIPVVNDIKKLSDENGTVSVDSCSQEGDTVIIRCTPNPSFLLSSLSVYTVTDTLDVTDHSFVMPDKPVTISATFKLMPNKITKLKVENGEIHVDTCASAGEIVKISAERHPGYELERIFVTLQASGEDVEIGADTSFVMPYDDVTIGAEFKPAMRSIKIGPSTNGTVSVNIDSFVAQEGDTVIVSAKPNKGCYTSGVSVVANGQDISMASDSSFIMPYSDVTVSASFKIIPDTIAPTIKLSSDCPSMTNADTIWIKVSSSEKLSSFNKNGIVAYNCSVSGLTTTDSVNYSFAINPKGNGLFEVYVKESSISDLSGNKSEKQSNKLTFSIDRESPAVQMSEIEYNKLWNYLYLQVEFSKPVQKFDSTCITISSGRVTELATSDSMLFTFKAVDLVDGATYISINPNVVQDNVGNRNTAGRMIELFYFKPNPNGENGDVNNAVELTDSKGFRMYPNPVVDYLIVETGEYTSSGTIELLNSNGIVVGQHAIDSDYNKIPVDNLRQGTYFIKVTINGVCSMAKFMKM